ncbi:MAG: molybdopterin synthase sulfur carrier subunit [Chloroflexi bacterium]|jgi:molybdopterin synthase sulfur carrier subunit|nr:MAG: molybdopterin synthase sulfur carrier subunit [Chloroflexota bacterium]
MPVTVRIPTPLRKLTQEQDIVSASGDTLAAIVSNLETTYPGLEARLLDEGGEIRRFVNVFVNGEDVRFLDGLSTAVAEGDEVSIVPAVAGGAARPPSE